MKICPKCRNLKKYDEKFCTKCGAELLTAEYQCPKCKKIVYLTDIYCYNCGLDLKKHGEMIDNEIKSIKENEST